MVRLFSKRLSDATFSSDVSTNKMTMDMLLKNGEKKRWGFLSLCCLFYSPWTTSACYVYGLLKKVTRCVLPSFWQTILDFTKCFYIIWLNQVIVLYLYSRHRGFITTMYGYINSNNVLYINSNLNLNYGCFLETGSSLSYQCFIDITILWIQLLVQIHIYMLSDI
jgi:hypothetical protein